MTVTPSEMQRLEDVVTIVDSVCSALRQPPLEPSIEGWQQPKGFELHPSQETAIRAVIEEVLDQVEARAAAAALRASSSL
jgi:hypothetical protein